MVAWKYNNYRNKYKENQQKKLQQHTDKTE